MILHRSNEELFQSFQKICFPFGLSAGLGNVYLVGIPTIQNIHYYWEHSIVVNQSWPGQQYGTKMGGTREYQKRSKILYLKQDIGINIEIPKYNEETNFFPYQFTYKGCVSNIL